MTFSCLKLLLDLISIARDLALLCSQSFLWRFDNLFFFIVYFSKNHPAMVQDCLTFRGSFLTNQPPLMSNFYLLMSDVGVLFYVFTTSYLTDSYIIFTLKMESESKITIFGLKMMVKSGLEKIFLKFLHALTMPFLLLNLYFWPKLLLSMR